MRFWADVARDADRLREPAMTRRISPGPDPAEASGYLRYFYRDRRPTAFGRIWSRAYAWLVGLGILPPLLVALHVRDRHTGAVGGVVLVAARHEGATYLVSMLGESAQWVKNLRAAKGKAQLKRGGWHDVVLREIPACERAPIIKAWAGVATSGRKHLPVSHTAPLAAFAEIADDFPVFRIDTPPE
jgi:hypothetical protein